MEVGAAAAGTSVGTMGREDATVCFREVLQTVYAARKAAVRLFGKGKMEYLVSPTP